MKPIILFLSLLFFAVNANAAECKEKPKSKKSKVESSVERQVEKHLFYPVKNVKEMEGAAEVVLEIFPNGNVYALSVQTKNPLIKRFVERQVNKMKVEASASDVGKIFRYRIQFKPSTK
jgi:hypothetical protein